MLDRSPYIQRFKELYEAKNKTIISDELAFSQFEDLICLVGAVVGNGDLSRIVLPPK